MTKFNYHDAYDAFRYGIQGLKTRNNAYRFGYFDNEPVRLDDVKLISTSLNDNLEFSCELQCDARQFSKLFKGPSKNELYRSHKEEIKRVIFNEPYTIVIWSNGEKTIVKAQDGEPYDKEKGLAMCFAKYALGNTCRYFDFFKEVCDEVEEKAETKESSK